MSEWIEFSKIEPFGDEWRQAASIKAAIYDVNRMDGQVTNVDEMMPIVKAEVEVNDDEDDEPDDDYVPQTAEELRAIFTLGGSKVIEVGNH